MIGVIYVYVETYYVLFFVLFCFFFVVVVVFFLMLSWMFQHDCLDTCCFECLICMCFVFLHLPLFSATEHVSH